MTLISRILGFVRDMLIASLFGVNPATDAFFVAFKVPNLLRRLFVEGAFAHAFLPVLSEYQARGDRRELKVFLDRTNGTLLSILAVITIIAIIAAPLLILLLAPGFNWQGDQHDLAASLLRIMLPFLPIISLVAFAGTILNAHGHFAVPALTPAFLNISMIAAALWLSPQMAEPVTALALGVLMAGIVQWLFQIPALLKIKMLPGFRLGFNDPGVKKILRSIGPALFSVSVTQINLLMDTLIASFLTSGSVSWLYYSDRLVEFPLGLLGIAVATVILPSLAKNHAEADSKAFSASLDWGLRLVILIGLPATLGLVILAEPMLSTLFQYHEFGVDDVHHAGMSLKAYAIGLLGFILVKVLVPGFTSRQDMETPLRYSFYAMLTSLALNLVLVFPLAHAGLALATSLGAFVNAALLLTGLLRNNIYRPGKGWGLFFLRVAIASSVMSAALIHFVDASWWHHWQAMERVMHLLKWISIALLLYAATLILTGQRRRL